MDAAKLAKAIEITQAALDAQVEDIADNGAAPEAYQALIFASTSLTILKKLVE